MKKQEKEIQKKKNKTKKERKKWMREGQIDKGVKDARGYDNRTTRTFERLMNKHLPGPPGGKLPVKPPRPLTPPYSSSSFSLFLTP